MMNKEKILKSLYLIVLFGGLFAFTIWRVKNNPDSGELAIKVTLNKVNREVLPLRIGEVASLDSMVYKNKKIFAYASSVNDSGLSHRYMSMYQKYKDLLLFATAGSDSERNSFKQLCDRYPNRVESICYVFQSTDGGETPFEIPIQELIDNKMTPSEMVVKCSELQFEIDGWEYPITYEKIVNGTITLLKTAVIVFMNEDIPLIDIYNKDNTVFWVFETKGTKLNFREHGKKLSTKETKKALLKHISNQPNVKEYLKFFSSTQSNLVTRYVNTEYNDTVDIEYPCELIRDVVFYKDFGLDKINIK